MKLFCSVVIVFLSFVLLAETHIPAGNISGNWMQENSPYIIDGEVTIPSDDLLTIEPGVDVIFSNHYKFIIYGRLLAEGTESDTIQFSAQYPQTGWKGLRFLNTETNQQDSSKVVYCKFENGNATEGSNSDKRGGALACYFSSDVLINKCLFQNNTARYGGAVAIYDSDILMKNSVIRNNYAESDAGGILIRNNSEPILENVLITKNTCYYDGGGIYCCTNASPTLKNVTISYNSAEPGYDASGGGISCWNSNMVLNDVSIANNFAEESGGGIEIINESDVEMNNVVISRNSSYYGGGIYADNSDVLFSDVSVFYNTSSSYGAGISFGSYGNSNYIFDPVNRSNIYLNNSTNNNNLGNDFFSTIEVEIIVDTFTVINPTDYYATPIENFTFDILNPKITLTESDLYVSPTGSDTNSGLSPDEPLKTIHQAINMIAPDNILPLNIYLAEGTYSPSQTGEIFPLESRHYISIIGESQESTILDAEETARIFSCYETIDFSISNLTAVNGHNEYYENGGALYCSETEITIENVTLSNNYSSSRGGAIYFSNCPDPTLINVTIKENSSSSQGGGIYCNNSSPNLSSVNVYENSTYSSGGGICFYNSTPVFDSVNRCNIYLNNTTSTGNDLYSNMLIDVIVDTFTVMIPDDYFASPIANFTFDILNSKIQNVNADLYVSPSGSDENSGLTPSEPLLKISTAYLMMSANEANPHTIYLSEGTFSPSDTGESYPLHCREYVTLSGANREQTILDAEGASYLLNCRFSNSTIQNLTVKNGSAGGIRIESQNCNFQNLLLCDNNSPSSGGGIYINECNPNLENLIIRNNSTERRGGGLYFSDSEPILSGISVFDNNADLNGGGLYSDDSNLVFDPDNRCNIYLNNTDTFGKDIYSNNNINVIVDTFTVMFPDNYFAYPMHRFTFDIMNSVVEQVDQDLYVSPLGSDENSGFSADEPMKTMNFAMNKITSNEENPHTIYLAEGVYSLSETGENFPIIMKRFISLTGGNSETTILNGENLNKIISSSFSGNDFSIQGISIINGNAEDGSYYEEGGGIYCGSSDLLISDVVIENNQAEKGGGLYFVGGDLMLLNVSVKNNNALNNNSGYGGGIYCSTYSCANFNNVLVTGNYASGNGGGIFCESWSEDAVFSNTVIKENSSDNNGGGIYFNSVNPELSSVSVTQNHGEFGGGIYFDNSEPNFDSENRCSIYSNTTSSAYSKDICLSNWNDEITVIVDTFTVYNPTDIHAYPIENFTFDIQNAVNGLIDADIYVNPTGSDYNSGLTPEDPLRTINYALCLIISNEEDPNNIYLSEGTYGLPNINGYSPLPGKSYVNIVGENPETTIIDGGNNCEIFFLEDIQNFTLQNALLTQGEPEVIYAAFSDFTLKNVIISGNTENARNIYCLHSDALLENVLMHNNITTHSGVYALSSSHLKIINSTFANNETTESGGMIGITNSDAEVINTICWNNSPNNFNLYHDSGTLTVAYSAIANGEDDVDLNGGSSTVNWLEGNIVIDPIFENPEIFNFLLQQDSPCIDTGTAFLEWNDEVLVDLSEDEYYGTAPDMGAFEYGMSSFDDNNINSPVKFSLSQNYPNPFNPITTISFSVSSKDTEGAKLEIYNIKGQKIITFCHPELVEGSVIWNGNDEAGNAVSSGVYFYKLRSGKKSAIKKMLLMK